MTTTLPDLIGTEKQVAWAEQIRAKALADAEARLADAKARGKGEDVLAKVAAKIAAVAGIADVRWWILNKGSNFNTLLERMGWVYRSGQWVDADGNPAGD